MAHDKYLRRILRFDCRTSNIIAILSRPIFSVTKLTYANLTAVARTLAACNHPACLALFNTLVVALRLLVTVDGL